MESIKNLLMTIKSDYHQFFSSKHKDFEQIRINNIHSSIHYINIIYLVDLIIDLSRLIVYFVLINHKLNIHSPLDHDIYKIIRNCKKYKLELSRKYKNNYNREKERKNVSLLYKTTLPNDICKYIISEFL